MPVFYVSVKHFSMLNFIFSAQLKATVLVQHVYPVHTGTPSWRLYTLETILEKLSFWVRKNNFSLNGG